MISNLQEIREIVENLKCFDRIEMLEFIDFFNQQSRTQNLFDLGFLEERSENYQDYQSLASFLLSTKFVTQNHDRYHSVALYETENKQALAVIFSRLESGERHSILFCESILEIYDQFNADLDGFVNNPNYPAYHVTVTNDDAHRDLVYKVTGEENAFQFMQSAIPGSLDADGVVQDSIVKLEIFVFSLLFQTIPNSIDPASIYLVFSENLSAKGYCSWELPDFVKNRL